MVELTYKVRTEKFEGPLDLLLQLIEKRKLFVNDISLAKVTDDFIAYIEGHSEFPMEEIAQFILVASTLLLIKSKSLLPMLELSREEESDIEDLEKRLSEYQRFKELSEHVKAKFGGQIIFGRTGKNFEPIFSPTDEISKESILEAARRIISEFPIPQKLPEKTVKKVVSLEETIERLIKRIEIGFRTSLKDFSGGSGDRGGIIVSFLAVLELIKRGRVHVNQEQAFGDIGIEQVKS